jgi:phosphoribosylformylglycinamidine synthase subunit PurQ / glutaminase
MKTAVIVFPGSNCDRDLAVALEQVTGRAPAMVWHKDSELPDGTEFIGLPGGFSYGDYLRSGAMAARSPIVRAVVDAANRGVPVLGICNGFQVLTETGLLPGALMRNAGLNFVSRPSPSPWRTARASSLPAMRRGRRSACRSLTTTAITRPTKRPSTGSRTGAA